MNALTVAGILFFAALALFSAGVMVLQLNRRHEAWRWDRAWRWYEKKK